MLGSLDAKTNTAVERTLRELATHPTVFVKISQMLKVVNGKPVTDPAVYRPVIDTVFGIFGEDKVIFGSDWPNAAAVDNLPAIVQIVKDYFATKGPAVAQKYFYKNSQAAYKWKPRETPK
jgi:L-fuconolactonase